MKLPNQKHGPVALKSIDYAPRLSEETYAFDAVVDIVGFGSCRVHNDGHGGNNFIDDRKVSEAIEAYAATLPDEPSDNLKLVVTCPGCGDEIDCLEEKDEESFTKSEYAEHYAQCEGRVETEGPGIPYGRGRVEPQWTLSVSADYLMSIMVGNALEAHEKKKAERKRAKAIRESKLVRVTQCDDDEQDAVVGYEAVIADTKRFRMRAGGVADCYRLAFLDHPSISRMWLRASYCTTVTSDTPTRVVNGAVVMEMPITATSNTALERGQGVHS